MLEQYRRIKREHQDSVLFFRLGDFYEMFSEDALEVSSLLNLTLTRRNSLPMCGIPYHASQGYIARLLRLGKKIAVCEQVSAPGKTKLMERKVVEVITPGTTVDENYLEKGMSNYLASLAPAGKSVSFAYIDVSTGAFYAAAFPLDAAGALLGNELERLEIRELIAAESLLEELPGLAARLQGKKGLVVNRWADWLFDRRRAAERLRRQFGTANLKGFGLEDHSPELAAAGALLDYLDETAKSLIPHVRSIECRGGEDYTAIDEATQRNLELARNLRDGTERYSLFETLDETKTAMGKRLLRRRLLHPLKRLETIRRRLDLTELFYRDQETLAALRTLLARTPDLERLSSRLAMDRAHGKDLAAIMNALSVIASLQKTVFGRSGGAGAGFFESPEAASFGAEDFSRLEELRSLLERGLRDNPSILLTEGNLIRAGFDQTLDELRDMKEHGQKTLETYLEKERAATGIASLKIRYNRLIGYYFEVTNLHLSRVPPYFIRRQGIAGGERFTTDALVKLESDINGASDRIVEMEKRLFLELRDKARDQMLRIAAAAALAAELDAAQSLAWVATIRGWVRPAVDDENRTHIIEGRHPVVEAHLPGGEFIPNDLCLEHEGDSGAPGIFFALITGPNMAGKSTYLRQAALITIMAQMGSFVPARKAVIGVTDRIYCRVGASDNLARGESTFLVEMNETAHILHTATEHSFVIMDEVGRGTGTADGLAIAQAVSEELLNRIRCRTLFATHFHELSRMEHPNLANRSMETLERDGEIVFLRKLREGSESESYGLHAAGLAGIPAGVLDRARELLELHRLREKPPAGPEARLADPAADTTADTTDRADTAPGNGAPDRAGPGREEPEGVRIAGELAALDADAMTPLEALKTIHRWKAALENGADGGAADVPAGVPDTGPGAGKNAGPAAKPPRRETAPGRDFPPEPSLFD
ncbi:MAG: DNA mismatch repair protein MutS [Treponema sp.]|jgi:DNA mismatch repair protein MutS|nr:DNA mismatch repair protein MutS [Treponema sp.]